MKKIFQNDSFFKTNIILAVVMAIIYLVGSLMTSTTTLMFFAKVLVLAICNLVILVSYKNHTKNVMKAAMGFMLGMMFLNNMYSLEQDLSFGIETSFGKTCLVFDVVIAVLYALIIINHFILNSSHASNTKIVLANQVLAILAAITSIVYTIKFGIMLGAFYDTLTLISTIASFAVYIFTAFSIVGIESRLDYFKAIREGKIEE